MRYTQPQGNARIDWSNPITRGIISALSPNGLNPLDVNGEKFVASGEDAAYGPTTAGMALKGGAYSAWTASDLSLSSIGSGDFSLCLLLSSQASGAPQVVVGQTARTNWIGLNSANQATLGGAVSGTVGGSFSLSPMVISRRSGVATISFRGEVVSGGYSNSFTVDGNLILGAFSYAGDYSLVGSLALFVAWNRALSPAEHASLSNNSWQIFADNEKSIFIGAGAAGGGLSITAELAAASASGYAATVNLQSAISSTVATATASGFTANVSTGNAITATLATTTASGQTATVNQQSNITSTHATASASGHTATVNRQLAFAATLANATASGQTATVNLQRSVVALQAVAMASGYAANVQLGNDLSISATQAAATASGFDVAINRQLSVASSVAVATASGFDASISNGASLAASYGLASADGYQAQVNLSREIAASLATASASGFTAAISTSTGTAVWPTPDQVLAGITYGPTGADYTGTATAGGYPTAADIAAAVRVDLSAELARIDAAISSRATVAAIMGATAP